MDARRAAVLGWIAVTGIAPLSAAAGVPPGPATNSATESAAVDSSPLVARGAGVAIHSAELEARVRRGIQEWTNSGRLLAPAQIPELRRRILNELIFTRLVSARAMPADRARAQFESRAFVDGLQRELGSAAALAEKLKSMGLTDAAFRAEKLEESLALAVSLREVRAGIHLPDSDVRKYYEENPSRWEQPEKVRVAHLMLATRAEDGTPLSPEKSSEKRLRLLKLRGEIRAGADFATLVKLYSEDTATRDSGGECTLIPGQMDPAFEKAAFALKPGELSDLVTTPVGYHLLLSRTRIPATKASLASVEADIRGLLIQREEQLRLPDYALRLRREAKLEVFTAPEVAAPAPVSK